MLRFKSIEALRIDARSLAATLLVAMLFLLPTSCTSSSGASGCLIFSDGTLIEFDPDVLDGFDDFASTGAALGVGVDTDGDDVGLIIAARGVGSHGKSWIFLAVFAASWFTAEMVWDVNELILEIDPYPSEADFFWLIGYPFYFGFLMFYLKPFYKAISKKMIGIATVFAIVLLIPAFYVSYDHELEPTDIDNILVLMYPLLDSIVLVPALIGVALFFTGKVNFLWALMCLAIMCVIGADIGFYFGTLEEDYYSGHPIEILFHWVYILFAFGIYNNLKVFKTRKINDV